MLTHLSIVPFLFPVPAMSALSEAGRACTEMRLLSTANNKTKWCQKLVFKTPLDLIAPIIVAQQTCGVQCHRVLIVEYEKHNDRQRTGASISGEDSPS